MFKRYKFRAQKSLKQAVESQFARQLEFINPVLIKQNKSYFNVY